MNLFILATSRHSPKWLNRRNLWTFELEKLGVRRLGLVALTATSVRQLVMKPFFVALAILLTGCATSHPSRSYDQPAGCTTADAVDQWKARLPQYSKRRVLVETLIGNPDARIMATGGAEKIVQRRDKDNKLVEVLVNEAGNIILVMDSRTGCHIGPIEYYRRVIN